MERWGPARGKGETEPRAGIVAEKGETMDQDIFARGFKQYQQYKRRADRSALEALAGLFIVASFAFWAVAFWQLFSPPNVLSLMTIQVAVLALVFAIAAPLLWSALVPTTPAGQLLQKTQWRTAGFVFIVGAAVYLTYTAFSLLETWMYNQLYTGDAVTMTRPLAVALAIAFILIPALAWTQLPYNRMLDQIKQAHEVRRLEIMQKGDLAILKNHLLWMESRALMGYTNLLPDEQRHVAQSIAGLLQGIATTQRRIARLAGLSSDYDRAIGIPGDDELNNVIELLTSSLEKPAEEIEGSIRPAALGMPAMQSHARATRPAEERSGDGGAAEAGGGSAATRGDSPRFAAEYAAARGKLSGVWKSADLAGVIGKSDRTARERIAAWRDQNLVASEADTTNSYYFT